MSGAGDRENSGPRGGPYVSESGSDATDESADNAVTQLLPMVNPAPPSEEPPVVRAIARRAAAALPALGRDDGSVEMSKSARPAIDRRKGAEPAAAARSDPPAQSAPPAVVEPPAIVEPPVVVERPAESAVAEPPSVIEPAVAEDPELVGEEPAVAEPVAVEAIGLVAPPSGIAAAEIAFRDASTDEWLLPDDVEPSLATPDPTELVRPGPPLLEADSWDAAPDGDSHNEAYHGKRRAATPALRIWVVIGLALVGLGSAVAIQFALRSEPPAVAAPTNTGRAGEQPVIVSTGGEAISGTSSPAASPTRSPSSKPVVPGPPKPSLSPTRSPTPPPFVPLPIEAESTGNTLGGSATVETVANASGTKIVQQLGDWGRSPGPGTLRFNNIAVPTSGTYVLTIFFVHPNGQTTRYATISVPGAETFIVTFTGNASCCATLNVNIVLTAGANTITIAGSPSSPVQVAPAIDKIVITRP